MVSHQACLAARDFSHPKVSNSMSWPNVLSRQDSGPFALFDLGIVVTTGVIQVCFGARIVAKLSDRRIFWQGMILA